MNALSAAPIFYYHSVAADRLSVKTPTFRAELAYLKQSGYHCLTVGEWLAPQENGRKSEKSVVLTFDDGFGSIAENVFPLLQEFGFRATFFIVPGYVGKTMWGDPVAGTWSLRETPGRSAFPMMTWDQIARVREAGMEIASHTLSHRNLTDLAEADARREIRGSKEHLEEKLGIRIRGFCYPRGRVNASLAGLVEEAGYKYACTTQPGYAAPDSNRFLLPRIPGPASMSDFAFRLKRFPSNVFTKGLLKIARELEKVESAMRHTVAQTNREG